MAKPHPLFEWLETHWVTPAFAGGLLMAIAVCFFGAASNTMAGWLYILSGMIIALLILGAILAIRSLRLLKVHHLPIAPVSAGQDLTVEIEITNRGLTAIPLIELIDEPPLSLSPKPQKIAIEFIPPKTTLGKTYYLATDKRGVYRWEKLDLRSGSPLGLFWCRRSRHTVAKAIVYPQILPLQSCPLIDTLGQTDDLRVQSDHHYHAANEGLTKTLRPYRYGDSMRLIHWRSSARFEEFKVRELEIVTGNEDVIIGLDTQSSWDSEAFEKAVITAASLYFYALRRQLNAKLWTGSSGLIQGNRTVLEVLAEVKAQESPDSFALPKSPMIWLTSDPNTLDSLPQGSRWVLLADAQLDLKMIPTHNARGLIIDAETPLSLGLEQSTLLNH